MAEEWRGLWRAPGLRWIGTARRGSETINGAEERRGLGGLGEIGKHSTMIDREEKSWLPVEETPSTVSADGPSSLTRWTTEYNDGLSSRLEELVRNLPPLLLVVSDEGLIV